MKEKTPSPFDNKKHREPDYEDASTSTEVGKRWAAEFERVGIPVDSTLVEEIIQRLSSSDIAPFINFVSQRRYDLAINYLVDKKLELSEDAQEQLRDAVNRP